MRKIKNFISAIFMLALTVTRRVVVVLDYPTDIDDFIRYARSIHQSMASSSYFDVALAAKLAQLLAHIEALEAVQTGVRSTLPTHTIAQRNVALLDVQNDLRGLRMDVQAIVDADLTNAEVIVSAA